MGSRERVRQDTGSRAPVEGGGISGVDKADDHASCALPYVSRISERAARVCATLRIYNEKKKARQRERARAREKEREGESGEDIIGF